MARGLPESETCPGTRTGTEGARGPGTTRGAGLRGAAGESKAARPSRGPRFRGQAPSGPFPALPRAGKAKSTGQGGGGRSAAFRQEPVRVLAAPRVVLAWEEGPPGGLRSLRPARVRRLTRTRAGTLTKVYFVSSEGAKGSASRRPPGAGGRAVRAPPGGRGGGCAAAGSRGPRPPGPGTAPARLAGSRGIWAWEAARSANKVPSGKRGP